MSPDFVIEPAIQNAGDEPVRIDRAAVPGDLGRQIHDGIKACDYAVVVLDELRPNVLYELGLAHAWGKPTILVSHATTWTNEAVAPFDLSMQQRLEYHTVEAGLVKRLEAVLRALPHDRGIGTKAG